MHRHCRHYLARVRRIDLILHYYTVARSVTRQSRITCYWQESDGFVESKSLGHDSEGNLIGGGSIIPFNTEIDTLYLTQQGEGGLEAIHGTTLLLANAIEVQVLQRIKFLAINFIGRCWAPQRSDGLGQARHRMSGIEAILRFMALEEVCFLACRRPTSPSGSRVPVEYIPWHMCVGDIREILEDDIKAINELKSAHAEGEGTIPRLRKVPRLRTI
jgi:hypothetical protein